MPYSITITVPAKSVRDAVEILRGLEARAKNPDRSRVLKNAAEWVRIRTLQNFINSEDPDGNPFAPLKYRKGIPLVLTGLMMTSAVAAGSSPKISGRDVLISVPTPTYGIFHLFGTSKMPARPWLGINADMVNQIAEAAAEDVRDFVATGSVQGS